MRTLMRIVKRVTITLKKVTVLWIKYHRILYVKKLTL